MKKTVELLSILKAFSIIEEAYDISHIVFSHEEELSVVQLLESTHSPLLYSSNWRFGGTAASTSKDRALKYAVLSTIARYSLLSLESCNHVRAHYSDLKGLVYNPTAYFNKIESDLDIKRDDIESGTFGWVIAENISKKIESYVPAQFIYPVYYSHITYKTEYQEPYLINQRQIINGCAASFTTTKSTLYALYEAIGTDALNVFYITQRTDLSFIKTSLLKQPIIQILEKKGLSVQLLAVPSVIGNPMVLAILTSQETGTVNVSMGWNFSLNLDEAIERAILHAYARYVHKRLLALANNNFIKIKEEVVIGSVVLSEGSIIPREEDKYIGHIFGKKIKYKQLSQCNEGSQPSIHEALIRTCGKMQEKGFEIWRRNVTEPLFARTGISVIKVFIPGLQEQLLPDDEGVIKSRVTQVSANR